MGTAFVTIILLIIIVISVLFFIYTKKGTAKLSLPLKADKAAGPAADATVKAATPAADSTEKSAKPAVDMDDRTSVTTEFIVEQGHMQKDRESGVYSFVGDTAFEAGNVFDAVKNPEKGEVIVIGRPSPKAPKCYTTEDGYYGKEYHIVLKDTKASASVSRNHLSIAHDENGYYGIINKDNSNRTYLVSFTQDNKKIVENELTAINFNELDCSKGVLFRLGSQFIRITFTKGYETIQTTDPDANATLIHPGKSGTHRISRCA